MSELRVCLYFFESDKIKISNELVFLPGGELYFDGYDIGKSVEEYWGDSDYEYTYTIQAMEVEKFYPLFHLVPGDQRGLLEHLRQRFNDNHAYSNFGKFMDENGVKYSSFKWM